MRRILAVLVVLVFLSGVSWRLSAGEPPVYIALGDSLATGLQWADCARPSHAESYAAFLQVMLDEEGPADAQLINLAADAETTSSFIGDFSGLGLRGDSQLARAVRSLRSLKARGQTVRLITVDIGGNDLLAARHLDEPGKVRTVEGLRRNLTLIYRVLRREAGAAPIATMTYYDPFNHPRASLNARYLDLSNRVITGTARRFDVAVAPVQSLFRERVAAGGPPLTGMVDCGDLHPTAEGHLLIAEALAAAAGIPREGQPFNPGTVNAGPAAAAPSVAGPDPFAALGEEARRKVDGEFAAAAAAAPQARRRVLVLLRDPGRLPEPPPSASPLERRRSVFVTRNLHSARVQAPLRPLLAAAVSQGRAAGVRYFWIVNAIALEADARTIGELARRPEVRALLPDRRRLLPPPIPGPSAGATQGVEWNISKIRAPEAWARGFTGTGVVVGSVDTGVAWDHPALLRQYRGWDGTTASHDYNWADFVGGAAAPYDDNDHGTHTTGTMVGDDGAGNAIGVAPGARWIAAKACNWKGSCYESDLLEAMQWMAAPTDLSGRNPDPARAPDVVNNSWGGPCDSEVFRAAVQVWVAAGIFPVFSNGNSGPGAGSVGEPACYPESFGVGATDAADSIAGFSSRGPSPPYGEVKPEASAPGVAVRSTIPGGYAAFSGTSMAAPHVAGLVALLLNAQPSLTVEQLEAVIMDSAVDLGDAGLDNTYGAGRIDAVAALDAVPSSAGLRARITAPAYTGSTLVRVSISANAPVAAYYVSEDPSTPAADAAGWSATRPTTFTVSGGDGAKTISAWVKDTGGTVSQRGEAVVIVDTTAPTASLILPAFTKSRSVPLTIDATDSSGIVGYYVSQNPTTPSVSGPGWLSSRPRTASVSWGDGAKSVYLWVRDPAGNVAMATASTTLDTRAPSLSLAAPQLTASVAVTLSLSASDTSGVTGYYLGERPYTPAASDPGWVTGPPTVFTLTVGDGPRSIYGWARDAAGNLSPRAAVSITLDTTPPSLSLALPAATNQSSVPVRLDASDLSGVTGFYLTESEAVPASDDPLWSATAPSTLGLSPGEGRKTVYAWARDRAGNVAKTTAGILLDTTPPIARVTVQPYTASRSLPLSLTVEDVGGVAAYYLSEAPAQPAADASGWLSAPPSSFQLSYGDGAKSVYAWARDAAGNIGGASPATTILDTRPPVVTLSLPDFTNSPIVATAISATDAAGVSGYYVSETWSTPSASGDGWAAQPPAAFTFSSGDGRKTLYVWAKDPAGNVSPAAMDSVMLDTAAPSIELSAPEVTNAPDVPIEVRATDTLGVAGYLVSEQAGAAADPASEWSAVTPTTFVLSSGEGSRNVYAWARDRADNVSAPAVVAIDLDTTPPVVTLSLPALSSSRLIALSLSAADRSGIAGYFISESSMPPARWASWREEAPGQVLLAYGDGDRTLYAWAIDRAGNISQAASAVVFVDTRPPRPSIVWPRHGAAIRGLSSISGQVVDASPSSGLGDAGFAILRRRDCAWWHPGQERFLPGRCAEPAWFSIMPSQSWSAGIGRLAEPGRYTLYVSFSDRAGNLLGRTIPRVTYVHFTISSKPSRTRR